MELFWLFSVLALASYRLIRLVVFDDGPFDVFLKLREAAGVYERGPNGRPTSSLGRLFSCPHCIGFWLSFPAAAALTAFIAPIAPMDWTAGWVALVALVMWFAVAGCESILFSLTTRS